MTKVGFVVALPDELKTLTKQRVATGKFLQTENGTLVALAGAGHDNATRAAELLLAEGVTLLVSWGCAAALDRSLSPGSLVLPEWIQNEEGCRYPTSARWHRLLCDRLTECMPVHTGPVLASKRLVAQSAAKCALADSTQTAALDMESAAIAEVARRNNIPFLAVRVIADPADMSLPRAVERSINEKGEVVLLKLFSQLASRPCEIRDLIRLGKQFGAAQQTLRRVAELIGDVLACCPFPLSRTDQSAA